jgi:FtsP/CotA-like multicopper oxidase with cupredoxin domain
LTSLYECQLGFTQHSVERGGPPPEPVSYPLHLINGRSALSPTQVTVKRGEVVRLRLINAGSATAYRVALAGHTMRVTHADGQPVKPVDVDTLEIGMAERYDVLVQADHPGVWQLAAVPSSPGPIARAVFKYDGAGGATPPAGHKPRELKGKLLGYRMLRDAGGYGRPSGKPDVTMNVTLNSRFGAFFLLFNGRPIDANTPLHVSRNAHVRFVITNNSAQIHPMHLHGHFFQVNNGTGNGPMKDTLTLTPSQKYSVDWIADNPGLWVFHCHNLYHMLNGLMHTIKVG